MKTLEADLQSKVTNYFNKQASYWDAIYQRDGVAEAIHQERLRATLALVDSLDLPPGARALDMGCGAGFATVGLARKRLTVDARDPVDRMVEITSKRAADMGLGEHVTTGVGDIHAIAFPDATFDLVVALGVLPWLPDVEKPISELSRVLKPGGHLIVTMDTKWQLRHFFDPFMNPALRRPREIVGAMLKRPWGVRSQTMTPQAFRDALARNGLDENTGMTLGFGPITFFKREMLPSSLSLKLNAWLQSLANKGLPVIRSAGSQYLALARRRSGSI